MNGPKEDLETAERICFRVEEAQWYYEDFIRPLDPTLPSMTLKRFCEEIFAHCPLLLPFSQDDRIKAFDAFLSYKKRVPVRGAIMLNEKMDKLVLVKGWKKGATWSFPRGKINKDEDDLDCAIREVYEETGYDLGEAGFVPEDRNVKSIELNMHEQQIRLFVFRGVPMDTHFEPRTRKEISAIEWWRLCDLPAFRKGKIQAQQQPVYKATNFYMVAPFLVHVRKWIAEQRKQDATCQADKINKPIEDLAQDELISEEDQGVDSNVEFVSQEDTLARNNSSPDKLDRLNYLTNVSQPAYHSQNYSQDLLKHHSGSALLALLHSKHNTADQQASKYLPHTALGHRTLSPYEPQSPQHLDPKFFHHCKLPPPPKFPVLEQRKENGTYHQLPIKKQHESMIEAQKSVQSHELSSIPGPHSHQPQHLIHPQPLPPYVQRAVFAQSPVSASPLISNAPPQLNPVLNTPQFSARQAPINSENNKQISPKLTNHTFALLNSFKSRKHGGDSTSSHLQNSEPTSKFQYPYNNKTSIPIPPIKQIHQKQHEEYSATVNTPWDILQNKMTNEESLPTQQQSHEMARLQAARDLSSLQESSNPAISDKWIQASTANNYYRDSVNTQHLPFNQSQYNAWVGQDKYAAAISRYNDQDSLKQRYYNPQENSSDIQHAKENSTDKNSINYFNHEPLKNDQRTQHLFIPHKPQELAASSSQQRQIFPTVHPSSNENGIHDIRSSLASLTQSATQSKPNLQNYSKISHTKSNELQLKSPSRGPGNSEASAVELSALDPLTKKIEKVSMHKNLSWNADRADLDSKPEKPKLPSREAGNLLQLLNPKIKSSLPLQCVSTNKIHPESSMKKKASKNLHGPSTSNSLLLQAKNDHRQKSHSLISGSDAPCHSDQGKVSGSSKDSEYIYDESAHPRSEFFLQQSEEKLPSHHGLSNGSFSRNPVSDTHSQSRGKKFVLNIQDTRRESQPISPADKGFLLSYLDAVVAKGTQF
ncbi:putative mrna decapping complex subunit 2 [Golovinomyces cichoracearum]|uniref:Putative mrna decapping complex subunit 2 n=1 Tax=Golovinomyces cichoracearum TaxID=62708 RepID=A0A420J6U7_9PEZI|nr:putative mrna decapping complex subunit 2 [Golovinomyces cichoracearum]